MAALADRLAKTSLVRPRRWTWIVLAAAAIIAVLAALLYAYLAR